MILSHPVKKYYAKATVVNSPHNPHNCTVYANGDTPAELEEQEMLREKETGLGTLDWHDVDINGNVIKD